MADKYCISYKVFVQSHLSIQNYITDRIRGSYYSSERDCVVNYLDGGVNSQDICIGRASLGACTSRVNSNGQTVWGYNNVPFRTDLNGDAYNNALKDYCLQAYSKDVQLSITFSYCPSSGYVRDNNLGACVVPVIVPVG